MAEEEKLKLGKGVAFDKSRLKRLSQRDETWEADFRALPKPIDQTVTHYLGMVVTEEGGSLLSESHVHGRPSVNDLATMLTDAMRRPLGGKGRRPTLVRRRGHHQWRELFPVLKELGVDVSVERGLPGIEEAYRNHLRRERDEHRVGMVKPSAEQAKAGATFPAIDKWVREFGWIEIGVQELFGFVARALHEGGVQVEDTEPDMLAEALVALEGGAASVVRGGRRRTRLTAAGVHSEGGVATAEPLCSEWRLRVGRRPIHRIEPEDAMDSEAMIDAYVDGVDVLRRAVAGMTPEQLVARPVAGRWSTLEVVCHLADFEPIYADRMKRVIATDRPLLLSAGREAFARSLAYHERDVGEELALIDVTRRQMARILRSLAKDAWDRVGIYRHEGQEEERSLRRLLDTITGHIPHHAAFIADKRRALGIDPG